MINKRNYHVKRFISYLIYVAAFGYLVIKADDYRQYLKLLYSTTFDTTALWLYMSIFPIIVGILLALPQFTRVFKQKGSWKVDWIVLLSAGLPSLCVAITPVIGPADFAHNWKFIAFIVGFHPSLVTVAGILFGFVLVTAISKQEAE
ncbi:MAG: hypothetical protein VB084_08440 [Syntrophomonadaceae bacterium]|nr:hypothetical protein [Syntrophomonadaceae bacterium]